MEKVIYELRPYFFLGIGLCAIINHNSHLMGMSGVLMLLASGVVLRSRYRNRGLIA